MVVGQAWARQARRPVDVVGKHGVRGFFGRGPKDTKMKISASFQAGSRVSVWALHSEGLGSPHGVGVLGAHTFMRRTNGDFALFDPHRRVEVNLSAVEWEVLPGMLTASEDIYVAIQKAQLEKPALPPSRRIRPEDKLRARDPW